MAKSQIEQIKEIFDDLGENNLYGKLIKTAEKLKSQEAQIESLYAEIGRTVYDDNPDAWPEQNDRLQNLMNEYAATIAYREELGLSQRRTQYMLAKCKSCGRQNPEGTDTCQECGAELEIS